MGGSDGDGGGKMEDGGSKKKLLASRAALVPGFFRRVRLANVQFERHGVGPRFEEECERQTSSTCGATPPYPPLQRGGVRAGNFHQRVVKNDSVGTSPRSQAAIM